MKTLVQAMHKTWHCKCEGATIEEAANSIGCNMDKFIKNVDKENIADVLELSELF